MEGYLLVPAVFYNYWNRFIRRCDEPICGFFAFGWGACALSKVRASKIKLSLRRCVTRICCFRSNLYRNHLILVPLPYKKNDLVKLWSRYRTISGARAIMIFWGGALCRHSIKPQAAQTHVTRKGCKVIFYHRWRVTFLQDASVTPFVLWAACDKTWIYLAHLFQVSIHVDPLQQKTGNSSSA